MTLYLAFDTETTGIVDPIDLVELGALLFDETGKEYASLSLVVKPDGYEIPEGAARVHGITTETALAVGIPLVVAISALTNMWALATARVAHNLEYDDKVIATAMGRLGRASTLPRPPGVCTKDLATPILDLPPTEKMVRAGYNKPKAPRLSECYEYFFNEKLEGAHSALVDARACARIYCAMLAQGLL